MDDLKDAVRQFWDDASCGERLLLDRADEAGYLGQMDKRYRLEPFIADFACFNDARGLDVLEIGIGLGADHHRFAMAGARLGGIDLTRRAVEHTRRRFDLFGLKSDIRVGDAESLPFEDASFDWVYSWGVLHHSPDTSKAVSEVWRVLRPGGVAKVMIYHSRSIVGLMLWLRYGVLRLRPFTPLREVYSKYLESPGTKAYTVAEARKLFSAFRRVRIRTVLTHGDLLSSGAGQRHQGALLSIARIVWPRWFIRRFLPQYGLFMLIEAEK